MSVWLLNVLNRLRSSLWLIPSCMVIAAILLSLGVPYLDLELSPKNYEFLGWLGNMGPEGAMTLLSTIAGSMITIAGVVFSITIVALALASSQFGPRLLGNFMRDRGNQIVLGTFIATFIYCLLVLRTIHLHSSGDPTPYWGTLVGLLLAVCSLCVLIYFMHHIAVSIQAPNLIAAVYEELEEAMTRLYPEKIGREHKEKDDAPEVIRLVSRIQKEGFPILADEGGYIQAIESNKLVEIARENNVIIHLQYRPGHFLIKGRPIGKMIPGAEPNPSLAGCINQQFICGSHRTQEQDLEFAILQLVEVAVRALSPGVNDPFTSIQCIDHLTAILCQLAQRKFPSPYRYDEDGTLRIITPSVTFRGLLGAAFHQIRQESQRNVAVIIRLIEGLGRVGECAVREEDRHAIRLHVEMLERGNRKSLHEQYDWEKINGRCREVLALFDQSRREEGVEKQRYQQVT